jgi:hypothetical protein
VAPGLVVPAPRARAGERRWIAVVLLVGLLHGLVYVLLIPPWQHYEEPAHFEYAWMILTRRSLPGYGAYDNAIRRELAISMADHGFFRYLGFIPNPAAPASDPSWIGGGPPDTAPLFHIVMTVPLALFSNADVTLRLYAVRLTALGLYVLLLWIAYLLVSELTPPGHPLRWAVPLGLALLPALTDIMTAFNDDVGATVVFSLFLLAAVRLLRRGPSPGRLLAVLGLAGLCAITKTTVLVALPLALVAVALAVAPRRWLPLAAALLAVAAVAGLLSVVAWGDALGWYRLSNQAVATRVERPEAPWGRHALRLVAVPSRSPARVREFIWPADAAAIAGQTVTVGAWIWASSAGPASLPQVGDSPAASVTVGTIPAFFAETVTVPTDTQRLAIGLAGLPAASGEAVRTFYYDGLVLVAGAKPAGSEPVLVDAGGQAGVWAGQAFTNLIRNGSAEQAGPWVRPWAESLFQRAAGNYLSPAVLVGALADYDLNRPIFNATANLLLESFWARFSWAQIGLPPPWYALAAAFTGLGVAGAALRWVRTQRRQPGPSKLAVAWLGLALLAVWGTVCLRGLLTVVDTQPVLPVARYAYPAIIPTLLILMAGWQTLFGRLNGWARPRDWAAAAPFVFFLAVDIVSVVTIVDYYHQV